MTRYLLTEGSTQILKSLSVESLLREVKIFDTIENGVPHLEVIETYCEGYEYSVEVIVVGGILRNRFVTLKRNSGPPNFYEHGTTSGLEPLNPAQNSQLEQLIRSLVAANAYDSTILHIEIRVPEDGDVFLIECNSRLCGDQISDLVEKAYGVNVLDAFFRYLDRESSDLFPKRALQLATRLYLTSETEGKLKIRQRNIAGLPVQWGKVDGDFVRHAATRGATRLGSVQFCSNNQSELETTEKAFISEKVNAFEVDPSKIPKSPISRLC